MYNARGLWIIDYFYHSFSHSFLILLSDTLQIQDFPSFTLNVDKLPDEVEKNPSFEVKYFQTNLFRTLEGVQSMKFKLFKI